MTCEKLARLIIVYAISYALDPMYSDWGSAVTYSRIPHRFLES